LGVAAWTNVSRTGAAPLPGLGQWHFAPFFGGIWGNQNARHQQKYHQVREIGWCAAKSPEKVSAEKSSIYKDLDTWE
jgi:hypothetical protein